MKNYKGIENLYIIPYLSNVFIHVTGDPVSRDKFFSMIAATTLDDEDKTKPSNTDILYGTFGTYSAIDNIVAEDHRYEKLLMLQLDNTIEVPAVPSIYNTSITMNKFDGQTLMCLVNFDNFKVEKGDPVVHAKQALQKLLACYAKHFPDLDIYVGYKRVNIRNPETKEKILISEIVSEYLYDGELSAHSCRRESETVALHCKNKLTFDIMMLKVHPIKFNEFPYFHYVKNGNIRRFTM